MEFEDSINITYAILVYIFQILDTVDIPVKQIITCLCRDDMQQVLMNKKSIYRCSLCY